MEVVHLHSSTNNREVAVLDPCLSQSSSSSSRYLGLTECYLHHYLHKKGLVVMCQSPSHTDSAQEEGPQAPEDFDSSNKMVKAEQPPSSTSTTSTSSSNDNTPIKRQVVNSTWTYLTEGLLHKWLRSFVVKLGVTSATYPLTTIISITFLSLTLIATGFFTNFTVIYSHEEIFTPFGSLPELHHQWIVEESGFALTRPFLVLLHRNGDSVLQAASVQALFTALATVQSTPGYEEACAQSQYLAKDSQQPTCKLSSATQFWNHDIQQLMQELNALDSVQAQDDHVTLTMSNSTFPDGTPVFHEAIVGNYQMAKEGTTAQLLTTAQSYIIQVNLPELGKDSDALEKRILDNLEDLREAWATNNIEGDGNGIVLEYFTMYAYLLEFERAVYSDILLVVLMMMIMVTFCCGVFYRHNDPAQSRALVGLFSIATIGMSLMTGYGLVWVIGVPFTNIAMMVPFIIVGVGLDDTFIITGAYFRKSMLESRQNKTSSSKTSLLAKDPTRDGPIVARVEATMQEVGSSISLTTTTTMLAFGLGAISSIPAIRWLCIYGFVCIGVDFIYQCTYFVAWMVLDERRVQAGRKDICFWVSLVQDNDDNDEGERGDKGGKKDDKTVIMEGDDKKKNKSKSTLAVNETITQSTTEVESNSTTDHKNFSERFMGWYADKLLHPVAKVLVLVSFAVYLAGSVYSTTLLTQEFQVENYVPKDSHVKTFFGTFEEYSSLFRAIQVYFRNEDQTDLAIQQQMMTYVDELSQLQQIGAPPEFFWLRDFAEMSQAPEFASQAAALGLQNATFEEQIDIVLSIPEVRDVYGADIVRDPDTGIITASRCYLYLRQIDMNSIPNQISVLMDQREVTQNQPINNQGKEEWSFFTFDDLYFFFELYSVSVQELIFTTVTGVAAVSFISFLLIPHWSAVAFVMPLIIALYFMLLGTMQYSGIHINAVTYVIIVMAIGLLVDFLMHMLLRYFESSGKTRHAKVKETLETMGSSILLGGLTTFIGVIPLAFSTTTIFMVVFKSFLAMVCLGCGVGLILLPVILSIVGPVVTASHDDAKLKEVDPSTEMFESNDSLQGSDLEVTRELDSSLEMEGVDGRSMYENSRAMFSLVASASGGTGEPETEFEV